MEVSELGLIENYVSSGFGFGVTVDIPGKKWSAEIRTIKLPGSFPPLSIGAMHTGSLKAVAQRFIDLAKAYSAELKKQS